MFSRKFMLVALVATPLAMAPANASAQDRGLERAAAASAQADGVGAGSKSQASKNAQKAVPPGLEGRDRMPPGIERTRDLAPAAAPQPEPEPEPQPEPEPDPEPEECATEWFYAPDGTLWLRDCHGNEVPLSNPFGNDS